MELTLLSWLVNGLLGVAMYFMKQTHDQSKEALKDLKGQVEHIRDTTFKKEEFKEFKEELWRRLDKYEASVERRIAEK